jgi:hypothetical protein
MLIGWFSRLLERYVELKPLFPKLVAAFSLDT